MMLNAEKKLKEKEKIDKNFKLALGNEIYLTKTREKKQIEKYFHFLLIAKDGYGHEALRKLSSIAWYNGFEDRRMFRVPTLRDELAAIVKEYPNSLIATTACIGNELFYAMNNRDAARIDEYINFCLDLFDKDFYLEIAPGISADQVKYNKFILQVSERFGGLPMVIGTDAHYARAEDRYIHESFLNSKDGEREVAEYYSCAHLMSNEEIEQHMTYFDKEFLEKCYKNSVEIQNKIGTYDIFRKQIIPKEEVKVYPKGGFPEITQPTLRKFLDGDSIQNRYWANECIAGAAAEGWDKKPEYMERLETEADVLNTISLNLEDELTAYHNTMKQYIDLFWECGSIVGPGRGSATGFLSNRCLGITQLDPIKWKLNYWRYLNKERYELPDIDIDLCPSRRPYIIKKIRERKGSDIRVLQVATFASEKSKSAVLTACRGYRHKDEEGKEMYPDGINSDDALYMGSLIPAERGFLWPLQDCFEGNEEKNRGKIQSFIEEVDKYPGLKDIMLSIENLVTRRGEHASGIILYNIDPWKTNAIMRAPNGDLTTQFDLHESESMGDTKFDFLLTDVSDRIKTSIELLQAYNHIDNRLSLRQVYNKYLHPDVINLEDNRIWDALGATSVLNIFQFNDGVGRDTAQLIKPTNPSEMTVSNALMRLMGEQGKIRPLDKFYSFRENPQLWEDEMNRYKLTSEEKQTIRKYYSESFGVPAYQETLMEILMEPKISHYSLKESNAVRKTVAKKKMSEIPALKEKFFAACQSHNLAEYVWDTAILPQLGYSFSVNHSLPYSFVGIQTIILGTFFPALFWNTANLIIDSQGTDLVNENDDEEEDNDVVADMEEETDEENYDEEEEEEETDTPTQQFFIKKTVTKQKNKTINYGRISSAIGKFQTAGITILPPDINKSGITFTPDEENNSINCGLRGITRIPMDLVRKIIANRPYGGLEDFIDANHTNKLQTLNLIKSGAFDNIYDNNREGAMEYFLNSIVKKVKTITLATIPALMEYNLFPEEYDYLRELYYFNKTMKTRANGSFYTMTDKMVQYYCDRFDVDEMVDEHSIPQKVWDKIYDVSMGPLRDYLKENKQDLILKLNHARMKELYDKDAAGSLSKWEMDSLSFYYHEHELAHINKAIYNISNYFELPEDPVVEFEITERNIKLYKLNYIMGAVLDKNKMKHTVTLLTIDGVVQLKVWNSQFAKFDKRISQVIDGKKKTLEESWFTRGNLLYIQGMRRGNYFIPKAYKNSAFRNPIMKITEVHGETFTYVDERYDDYAV